MLEVGSSFIFWPMLYLEGWSSRLSYFIAVALHSIFKFHVCSFCRFLAFHKKVKLDCKLVKNRRSGDNLRAHLLLGVLLVQRPRILYPCAAADDILSSMFRYQKKKLSQDNIARCLRVQGGYFKVQVSTCIWMVNLYYSSIYPHLIYGIEFWGHALNFSFQNFYSARKRLLSLL